MKTFIRNFLSILRRFRLATCLNVAGLSLAFAAFLVIMMQVGYDWYFNAADRHADMIFRLDKINPERGQMALMSRPLADTFIQSSPHIKAGALVDGNRSVFFSVEVDGKYNSYEENCKNVYPEITDVFDFVMVEGSADALKDSEKVLMPQSMARKLFGNQPAVGQILQTQYNTYSVGGVYRDFPKNSSIRNCLYFAFKKDENLHSWNSWNYTLYIRVDKPENAVGLVDHFMEHFDVQAALGENLGKWGMPALCLVPLKEIHFTEGVLYDLTPKTSRQTLWLLLAIAFVIVVIAGINFTNFSMALTPMRIRSINTQKILGSPTGALRMALVLEAILIAMVSFILALLLVHGVRQTFIAALVDADMDLLQHLPLIGLTAGVALLTGMLAGLYPSWYMTSFQPALVLKGSFGLSQEGRKLRNGLIGIQFVASFSLIIGSLFMYLQNYYMHNEPLGYDKDQVIVAELSSKVQGSYKAVASQLKTYSEVEDVAFASVVLSGSDQYMSWGRDYHGEEINYECLIVDAAFMEVMGIQLNDGRYFREEDMQTKHGAYIFNETAHKKYNLQLGDRIDSAQIVGFIPDVKFASFRREVMPMAFFVWGKYRWEEEFTARKYEWAYIKLKAGSDLHEAMHHVRTALDSFDPGYPFNVRFFDEVLDHLYKQEENLSRLITLFSLIAIFISIVGVFGLVVFESEYRRKEIGIRKVLGSTTSEILVMFNKSYLRILLLCFMLAAPLAWYGVSRWLENFAYKTPMRLWVYAVAFVLVSFVTLLTVTFQNWRTANENPVHSIKNE